jgi:hypothetical protein
MIMKQCIICSLTKPVTDFGKHATTADRLMQRCKTCQSAYNKQYRDGHKDRIKLLNRELSIKNADKRREVSRQWREDNPERRKKTLTDLYQRHKEAGTLDQYYGKRDPAEAAARAKKWRKDNPARVAYNIAQARARRLQAIPKWVTKEERDAIKGIYEQCRQKTIDTGVPHQVDHIIPLVSDIACGLHCLANLQILTADENNSKKCKVDQQCGLV